MNIWIANHYAMPPSGSGPMRHHSLARHLIERGHDVTLVAAGFEHYSLTNRLEGDGLIGVETIDGVRYVWLRTPSYDRRGGRVVNMAVFAWRLARLAPYAPAPRPDVLVGSSPHILTPLAALIAGWRMKVPVVVEVRDIWPQSLVDLGDYPRHHPAIVALSGVERLLYRRADHVITLLPGAVAHILDRGGRPGSVSWLPNGTDVGPAPADPSGVGPFTVMYAGTLGIANGLDVVVEAARLLAGRDDIRFRLIGPGPERPRLTALAAGLPNIAFEDPVPKSEIADVLAEADAFVMALQDSPVFRHGVSPNKLFDYFAAARPVIFAVGTDHDPVAAAGAGLSIAPADPKAMAEAVVNLAALSRDERQEMAWRGRTYVCASHQYASLAERFEGILTSVVATRLS